MCFQIIRYFLKSKYEKNLLGFSKYLFEFSNFETILENFSDNKYSRFRFYNVPGCLENNFEAIVSILEVLRSDLVAQSV